MISIDPPLFSVQLVDSYLYRVSLERGEATDQEKGKPTLAVTLPDQVGLSEDGSRFATVLQAQIRFPYNDDRAIAKLTCSVAGVFQSKSPLARDAMQAFAQKEGVLLLYPYLRASVGQIWRMTGLTAPPLPTLDVLSIVASIDKAVEEGRAKQPRKPRRRKAATSS